MTTGLSIFFALALAEAGIYAATLLLCLIVVYVYLSSQKRESSRTAQKIAIAKEEGRHEPLSLHPYIDLDVCIGSGACIKACPEKDILGLIDNQASVIQAASCIGHGACFHACPVEAISLRIGTETRGVELPHVNPNFETNMQGIYIAGELGGMGLIKNSVEQGRQAMEHIAQAVQSKVAQGDVKDVIIIGAGPAGISAALTARKHGLNFEVLEQYTLGGTVYSFPREKIVMTAPMQLDLYGKVKLYETSKDALLKVWNEALSKNNISIRENTKVERVIPQQDGSFKVVTAKEEVFFANHVLIAIGRRGTPRKLGVEGEDLPKVYYRLLDPEFIHGKEILVVGGGDSAVESAMLLMDQNKVTLSYRKDRFARIKQKNRERLREAEQQGKLHIIYNSNVSQIKMNEVVLRVKAGEEERIETMPNDLVYIFAGGELPTKFLQNAGVEITKRFAYVVKKPGA